MVSHFQKLFDITSLSGVYPRMNEVYTRLGEMTTAMRNLRDILALGRTVCLQLI
jgi:centrosomal protein CEP70